MAPDGRPAKIKWAFCASDRALGSGRRMVEIRDVFVASPSPTNDQHRECSVNGSGQPVASGLHVMHAKRRQARGSPDEPRSERALTPAASSMAFSALMLMCDTFRVEYEPLRSRKRRGVWAIADLRLSRHDHAILVTRTELSSIHQCNLSRFSVQVLSAGLPVLHCTRSL